MVFDPWIGDIVSIPCLQGRCKRDPGVPGVWRHKTPNPGVEKRDPGVESLLKSLQLQSIQNCIDC